MPSTVNNICPYIYINTAIIVALCIMLIGIVHYLVYGSINAIYVASVFAGVWIFGVLFLNYDYYDTQACKDQFKKDEFNNLIGTKKRPIEILKKEKNNPSITSI
jgi:hypothetical protein